MASEFEIRREGEIDYAKPLARALLRDSRLSFGARGLFSYLWDLPQGWRANSAHLVSQSPQGRDAIRTLLKELEAVGAMRSEDIRGASGHLNGKRWVLVAPDRWAVEAPLSNKKPPDPEAAPAAIPTEGRVFRLSENPTVGESNTKVHQGKGSSIKTTTNQVNQVVEDIDELVEAAAWAFKNGGGKINNEAGFKHKVRTRILSCSTGPSSEDMQSLLAWRANRAAAVQRDKPKNSTPQQKENIKAATPEQLAKLPVHLRNFGKVKNCLRGEDAVPNTIC